MIRLVMMCACDGLEKHVWRCGLLMACVFVLTGCQSPGRMGVVSSTWQGWSPERQKTVKQSYKRVKAWQATQGQTILAGDAIRVRVSGGTVFWVKKDMRSHYQPLSWVLSPGQCKTVQLRTLPENARVALSSCYLKGVFSLDPSRYQWSKRAGTLFIHQHPYWQQGVTYQGANIQTAGYASLQGMTLRIADVPPVRQ